MNKEVKGLIRYIGWLIGIWLLIPVLLLFSFCISAYEIFPISEIFALVFYLLIPLYFILPPIITHRAITKHWSKYLDKFFQNIFFTTLVLLIVILVHKKVNFIELKLLENLPIWSGFVLVICLIDDFIPPTYYFAYPIILIHQIVNLIKKIIDKIKNKLNKNSADE